MALVKERLDGLNHAEFKLPRYRPSDLDLSITEVRARHNVVAIRKGDNSAPSQMNSPQPIGYQRWLTDEVRPLLVERSRDPAVLRSLDRLHLRGAAGRLRRLVLPSPR